jgi:hypothetical protein
VRQSDKVVSVWHIRFICVLAVISGIVLLIVDSPISTYLPIPISHQIAEAIPLLLVGIAYLAWLAVDRPQTVDLIKQVLIAVAFVLWGISLLMPTSPWSRLVGALVIAIYLFDLVWLMEGNLHKKFGAHLANDTNGSTSPNCLTAGVCSCDSTCCDARVHSNRRHRTEAPSMSSKT